MGNAHHQDKLVQYEPLSAPDYREKGFAFAGDPIVIDAMRRWPSIIGYRGSYEDFLRDFYIREAKLQDALVVNLGTGDPLTEDEVRVTDPYCLAVMYDDGSFSKDWDLGLATPKLKQTRGSKLIQPNAENLVDGFAFNGSPCVKCGGTLRYVKSRICVPCSKSTCRNREKRQLAVVC